MSPMDDGSLATRVADPPPDGGAGPDSDPDLGFEAFFLAHRPAVGRALAPLTPRQRAAVVLTDVLGFTSEEAAEALGVRPATVRVLAARARTRLREAMGEER